MLYELFCRLLRLEGAWHSVRSLALWHLLNQKHVRRNIVVDLLSSFYVRTRSPCGSGSGSSSKWLVVVQPRSQESVSAVKESSKMTLSRSITQSSVMLIQLLGMLSRLLSSEESGKRRRGKRR